VAIAISGTYAMSIEFQSEVVPGSGAWIRKKGVYSTANATVADSYITEKDNEKVRLIVMVDTSGTAVATLTDTTTTSFGAVAIRDPLGNGLLTFNEDGATFSEDLAVTGDFTGSGDVTAKNVPSSVKSVLFEDFIGTWAIGDAGPADHWSSTAGSGTGTEAGTTVANSVNGEITLKSSSADAAHAANCSSFTAIGLAWKANQGGLAVEARLALDDVSEAVLFVGFTDVISTTVELPIFMNAADLDSDANDACGVIYDVDATTDQFYVGGVKATADTAPVADVAVVPADTVPFVVRVEVDTAGTVTGYINGVNIGSVINAVTVTTALTPAIIVGNRSANQVTATIDYIRVEQNR
jgi:hypothetical protein